MRVSRRVACAAVAATLTLSSPAAAEGVGQVLEDPKLADLDGKPGTLADRASGATVVVFFRPGHERSAEALRAIAGCDLGKRARVVGVVSDQDPVAEVRATLAGAGTALPVLLDAGDALYARLGVRTHPTIAILDKTRRITTIDPYHALGSCEVLRARVGRALGELSEAEASKALAPERSRLPGEDPLGVAVRHVKFGRKLLAARSYDEAHRNARKSLELAPSAAAWALEGEIFAAEGKCEDAGRAFDAALKLDPKDAGALAGKSACGR